MGKIQPFTILSLSVVLCASAVWASIPPSEFLIKSLARKHSGFRRIQVKTQVSKLDGVDQQAGMPPSSVHFVEQTAYYPTTGILRSWALDDHGTPLYEIERHESEVPVAARLLFESKSTRLIDSLKSKGIPIATELELEALSTEEDRRALEKERMLRWNHTVAWVVGNEEKRSSPLGPQLWPQLWIEKDSFLPLRLIAPARDGEALLGEMQYDGFRSYHEFPYPRSVTWLADGKNPYFRAEVLDVSADAGPDLSHQAIDSGWTSAGQSASGPLKDLISAYYAILR